MKQIIPYIIVSLAIGFSIGFLFHKNEYQKGFDMGRAKAVCIIFSTDKEACKIIK